MSDPEEYRPTGDGVPLEADQPDVAEQVSEIPAVEDGPDQEEGLVIDDDAPAP